MRASHPVNGAADSETGLARVERSVVLLVTVATLGLVFALGLDATGIAEPVDRHLTDALMMVRDDRRVPAEIVIVALDRDATRREHAIVIETLQRARPKLIAYNVVFASRKDPVIDDRLFRALSRARPLVLGSLGGDVYKPGYVEPRLFKASKAFDASGIRVGVSAYPRERDEKVRRIALAPLALDAEARTRIPKELDPLDMPSFPYVVAAMVGEGRLSGDISTDNVEIIDFHGPPRTFKPVRFGHVLSGDLPAYVFRDKIVLVGETRRFGGRTYDVPTGDAMDLVEVDANAIATLLAGAPLREPSRWTYVLVLMAAACLPIAAVAAAPWTAAKRLLLVPTTAVAIVAGAWPNFDEIIFWPLIYAAVALGVSWIGTWLVLRGAD